MPAPKEIELIENPGYMIMWDNDYVDFFTMLDGKVDTVSYNKELFN